MKKFLFLILVFCSITTSSFAQDLTSDSSKEEFVQILSSLLRQQLNPPTKILNDFLVYDVRAEKTTLIIEYRSEANDNSLFPADNLLQGAKSSFALNFNQEFKQYIKDNDIFFKFIVTDKDGNEIRSVCLSPSEMLSIDKISVNDYLNDLIKSEFPSLPVRYDGYSVNSVYAEGSSLFIDSSLDEKLDVEESNENFIELVRTLIVSELGPEFRRALGSKGINIIYNVTDAAGHLFSVELSAEYLLANADKNLSANSETVAGIMVNNLRSYEQYPTVDEETGIVNDIIEENGFIVFKYTSPNQEMDQIFLLSLANQTNEQFWAGLLADADSETEELLNTFSTIFRYISSDGTVLKEFVFEK